MAFIESHQELLTNPKTMRAAKMLDLPIAHLVGHLHLLWWWAFDHAFETGDLSRYDAFDLANAAGWDGDPAEFVRVLIECGPRGRSGFIDGTPDDNDTWKLHDWLDYTAAMRERRESSAKANHVKWHVNKGRTDDSCQFCRSGRSPGGVRAESEGNPAGRGPDSEGDENASDRNPPDLTEPDLTGPNQDQTPPSTDVDHGHDEPADTFEQFWAVYPKRSGRKVGKANALVKWRKLTLEQRRRAYIGARNLAASDQLPKDAERFLRRGTGGEFPFDDWQQPAEPGRRLAAVKGPPRPPDDPDVDYRAGWAGREATP